MIIVRYKSFSCHLCNHVFKFLVVVILSIWVAIFIRTTQTDSFVLSTLPAVRNDYNERRHIVVFALGKAQKKQIELSRKLDIAKQQHQSLESTSNVTTSKGHVGVIDKKHNNVIPTDNQQLAIERSEFSLLLTKYKPPVDSDESRYSSHVSGKLAPKIAVSKVKPSTTKQRQISPEILVTPERNSTNADNLPLQVGEKARRLHFEALIHSVTKQPLGSMGAAKLVPWVPPFIHRYLIIIIDPRKQSSEFRTTVQYLEQQNQQHQQSNESMKNIIAITSDTSEEISAWMRRVQFATNTGSLQIFSDPKLEWMTTYSIIDVGQPQWSVCILSIDENGILQTIHRNVDPKQACRIVSEIVTAHRMTTK